MEAWSVHHLYKEAETKYGLESAVTIQKYAQQLISSGLPVIFSLRHLAKITQSNYIFLHETVGRHRESANYKMFQIKKRSGGRRFIHAVSGQLLTVQQFINKEILQQVHPHPSSFAFHIDGGIRKCASMHCGAKWLFQFDLADFFYNVTEIDAFHVFLELGYRKLLAFELARISTTTHLPKHIQRKTTNRISSKHQNNAYSYKIQNGIIGVLPQGAPTSPMLSNLAARCLDELLFDFAIKNGFVYTRYADDLTISANKLPDATSIGRIYRNIIDIIRRSGFKENKKKIRVAGPGSKKVVLGLLVDGDMPRISREMYHRIDRQLYATKKFGIEETAMHEGFDSAFGFHNHLRGLVAFVSDVDKKRWAEFHERFSSLHIPWDESYS